MKLAVIFWFYKEPTICVNRLKLIRKYNPNIKIFGLYGGKKEYAKKYKSTLDKYLDDFYISTLCNKPKEYKWIHGDLMLLDWYRKRGINLKGWDSVAVVQWDALILGNIKKQFSELKKGELFISGFRRLNKYIEDRWSWTKKGSDDRNNYLSFREYIKNEYGYDKKLFCSLFIFQIFPREFFDKWLTIKNKEIGMLEYKIPTYANIFDIPIYKQDLGVWWFNKRTLRGETPLNARNVEISKELIDYELKKKDGFRIFHPYFREWN